VLPSPERKFCGAFRGDSYLAGFLEEVDYLVRYVVALCLDLF